MTLVLAALACGLTGIDTSLAQDEQFRSEPDALIGQRLIAASFPAGAGSPTTVLANARAADAVRAAILETPGVTEARPDGETDGLVAFAVTLTAEPGSAAAFKVIEDLRASVRGVPDGLTSGPALCPSA